MRACDVKIKKKRKRDGDREKKGMMEERVAQKETGQSSREKEREERNGGREFA